MLRKSLCLLALSLLTGCASGLNSYQSAELSQYEARGLAVEEKNPGLAAGLGLLPGGGSFYSRAYGFGVVNLLFWPLSILWDPVSGYDAARAINYQATKAKLNQDRDHDMAQLDEQLQLGQVDASHYVVQKRQIENKYGYR